ncbi:hypothetical protein V2P57_00880 [Mycoplasma mycoides subsp. mycoides]|uniref:Uncharacterized protein n=1 Tax=Mycoplasma mycoides subsp. mycoides TaxID=2103 RepID=A0AAE2EHG7_MYCMY|nr:hypothetical protein [Mycoplasma mycoides]QQY78382.1 hypothetical protein JLS56_00835 [Mycoplasma mycoides subsp. capri]ADK70113.1 conserved domain protein [Mycoplasma mycoides subsp. mycoides SC str. Gladysdale]AIZ55021.1 F transposase protein A [Mycoplasma mycoides subsp. mycoides]AME10378.1 hypothetical protein MmmBen_0181 [Mycoplasma mycoides subsp. mycoides]AME11385.1 hypothetical protein MmmBen50_0178 [Mycoplasma mycoides subsp. mycoides]
MSKLNLEKKLKIVKEAKKLNIKKSTYLANKYDLRFPLSRENTQFSAAIFFYKKI